MESQALGTPLEPNRTVKSVVGAITGCQGAFIVGPTDATFAAAADSIVKMLTDAPVSQSPRGGTHAHQTLLNTVDNKSLIAEIKALKSVVGNLEGKVSNLEEVKVRQQTALASLGGDVSQFGTLEALAAHVQTLLRG